LELLIGMVLLAVMLNLLFSGLRLGARAWDSTEDRLEAVNARELALRFLDRQLAIAEPTILRGENLNGRVAFIGDPDRVTWVAPLPAHRGGGGLQRLELAVGEAERGAGLVLRYEPYDPEHFRNPERDDDTSTLLLEGVESMDLAYYGEVTGRDEGEWSERWEPGEALPQLIRLQFTRGDDAETVRELIAAPRQALPMRGVDFGP
jgi:general secretion pathway protein J